MTEGLSPSTCEAASERSSFSGDDWIVVIVALVSVSQLILCALTGNEFLWRFCDVEGVGSGHFVTVRRSAKGGTCVAPNISLIT